MFLYNISIIMEDSVHEDLLSKIKDHLKTNKAQDIKLLKMLHSPHEGQTYCLQANLNSQEDILNFQQEVLHEIQAIITNNFVEKAFLFDSTMQYIGQE